jgi:LuxR family transcriptional activator of conjugal transfer of Ti plasmids
VVVGDGAAAARAPSPRLTARERTVLSLLNRGWDRDDVAMLERMAPSTVAAHLANARRKLGAATDADAIAAAEAWGLLG